jgi:hypothetical protein
MAINVCVDCCVVGSVTELWEEKVGCVCAMQASHLSRTTYALVLQPGVSVHRQWELYAFSIQG